MWAVSVCYKPFITESLKTQAMQIIRGSLRRSRSFTGHFRCHFICNGCVVLAKPHSLSISLSISLSLLLDTFPIDRLFVKFFFVLSFIFSFFFLSFLGLYFKGCYCHFIRHDVLLQSNETFFMRNIPAVSHYCLSIMYGAIFFSAAAAARLFFAYLMYSILFSAFPLFTTGVISVYGYVSIVKMFPLFIYLHGVVNSTEIYSYIESMPRSLSPPLQASWKRFTDTKKIRFIIRTCKRYMMYDCTTEIVHSNEFEYIQIEIISTLFHIFDRILSNTQFVTNFTFGCSNLILCWIFGSLLCHRFMFQCSMFQWNWESAKFRWKFQISNHISLDVHHFCERIKIESLVSSIVVQVVIILFF